MGWNHFSGRKPLCQAVYSAILATASAAITAHAAANPVNNPAHSSVDNPWDCRAAESGWVCQGSPSTPQQAPTTTPSPASPAAVPLASPDTISVDESVSEPSGDAVPATESAADPDTSWSAPAAQPSLAPPLREVEPTDPSAENGDSRVTVTRHLDWVPMDELDEADRDRVGANCCGAYIEPQRYYTDGQQEPDTSPLRVTAGSTEAKGNVAVLTDDVQISQGYRQVRSDSAVVDRQERTVELEGNIIFREPGMLMMGDRAKINMSSGHADIDNAEFLLHESAVRGTAGTLSKRSENRIHVDDATYTTCEPISNAWQLKTSDLNIDTARGSATAKHVRLEVRDWPVFYLPWIRFPITDNRATGLLYPVIMAGNENGLDFSQPIYLNLAPNYDATLTPRYVQERGGMLEAEFRYLNHWSETTLSGGYLHDDKGGDVGREETSSGLRQPYRDEDRWVSYIDHRGGFGKRWSTRIDYTNVSDPDYFRDLGTATLQANSQSHLNQQFATAYRTDNWLFRLQAQQFETLIKGGREQYKQMPRFDANGLYQLGGDFSLQMRQHVVVFDHSESSVTNTSTLLTRDTANTTVTGNRLRADYALSWDKQWLWGFFKPTAKLKHASYDLDRPLLNQHDDSPSVTVPVFSVDGGLYFEKRDSWLSNHIQTLEPRVFYVRSSYRDQSAIPNFDTSDLTFSYQQLFRDDRFSGSDRIGDTDQFTLGLTTRLINANNGIERLRFSVGQVHYLKDRRVTLNPLLAEELTKDTSDIAAEATANLFDHWRLQADLLYDENDGAISKGSAALRYNNREGNLFNLVYRYTRRDNLIYRFAPEIPVADNIRADIDQVDLSLATPLSPNWRLLARYNHDMTNHQELEVFAGLEYSSCCWRASLVARRWVDRDDTFIFDREKLDHRTGLFFQIQFRGLAGTGTRVTNILSEGIYGYQPPEF
ncbi:MAG: LPS assembly protein LptD [Porticoccaceae bacterium]|nr:LPS assembly protein LptD [Porticoccaceae bacterium]